MQNAVPSIMKNEDIIGLPCVYRISIKAIIRDHSGRILLIREKDGGWELPGGGLEHNETALDCLKRELQEEIGVTARAILDAPSSFWTISADVSARYFGFVAYETEISGTPELGEEADEVRYFDTTEIQHLELHSNTAPFFN